MAAKILALVDLGDLDIGEVGYECWVEFAVFHILVFSLAVFAFLGNFYMIKWIRLLLACL